MRCNFASLLYKDNHMLHRYHLYKWNRVIATIDMSKLWPSEQDELRKLGYEIILVKKVAK